MPITLFLIAASTAQAQSPAEVPRYTFGIVPQQTSNELARAWIPILSYLSDKTKYILDFTTAKDIHAFEQRAMNGDYDFIYINPLSYVAANRSVGGYKAFAKERDSKLNGIIVVHRNSQYKILPDLNNLTIAFPAPTALAASIIPQAYFESNKVNIKTKYVSSHDSVYLLVAKGIYPAGGGVIRTLETLPTATRDQLRILWTSPGYTPHPFAAHKRIPLEVINRIRDAMVNMDKDQNGKALLDRIAFNKGISAANDLNYNDMRALKLTTHNKKIASPNN